MVESTGGISTPQGSFLVTPSGKRVGSTTPEFYYGGSRGRSSSSSPPPAPTYESSLLNQSFSSQQALQQAEAKYKLQQAIQAKQEEQRQSRISSGRTTGQFGGGIVTAASTTPYKDFIKDKNPFTSTITYGVERTRGYLSKKEEKRLGQNPFAGITGERLSSGVQAAPYFIPATAPAFLILTGVGAVTPGGLTESKAVGKSVQSKYPWIPSKAVSIGYTGSQVAGGALGTKLAVGQVGKPFGFPKYDVKFLSRTTSGDKTLSTGIATEKTLTGSGRQVIFASEDAIRFSEPGSKFQAVSRGVVRPYKGVDIVTGKGKFGKPKPFGSQASGIVKQGEQIVGFEPIKGVSVSKQLQGFDYVATTRTKLFKPSKEPVESLVLGKGYDLPSGVVTSSKFAPIQRLDTGIKLSRTGRGNIFGVTYPQSSSSSAGSLILKSTRKDTLSKELFKSSLVQASFPTKVAKPSRGLFKGVSASTFPKQTTKQSQSAFYGTGQYERTSDVVFGKQTNQIRQATPTTQFPTTQFKDNLRLSSGTGLAQPSRTRQRAGLGTATIPAVKTPSAFKTPSASALGLGSGLKNLQKQLSRTGSLTFPKSAPSPFKFPTSPIPPIPRPSKFRTRTRSRKAITSRAGERYSPDLGSILFGRRGKKPKRGVFGYSPGRVRPIPI